MVKCDDPDVRRILAEYPASCQPTRIESRRSAGGFSGANLWRLETPLGILCLRRFPAGYAASRIDFIHSVIHRVRQNGFRLVPVTIETSAGLSCLLREGFFWELSTWLPGQADFQTSPNQSKLRSALSILAQFHIAAGGDMESGKSPSAAARLEQISRLMCGGVSQISRRVEAGIFPELAASARQLLHMFSMVAPATQSLLAGAVNRQVSIQPCLRDVHADHILFEEDHVSGLIDFGAMRLESVVVDITRLLGSLVEDDETGWRVGIEAYQIVRPLSEVEQELIPVFDRSTIVLSGMNWLEWLYLERRQFENLAAVAQRMETCMRRMQHLASRHPKP